MKKRTKKWLKNTELIIALVFCFIVTSVNGNHFARAEENMETEKNMYTEQAEALQDFEIDFEENIEETDQEIIITEAVDTETADIETSEKETSDTALPEAGEDEFTSEQEPVISPVAEEPMQAPEIEVVVPGLNLVVESDTDSVKAGKKLVYIITVENTGNVDLHDLTMNSILSKSEITGGIWEDVQGLSFISDEKTAEIERMEAGQKRQFYYTIQLPQEMEEILECRILVNGKFYKKTQDLGNVTEEIKRESSIQTKIVPLTVDFSVTKTADRSVAVPGDIITYQICIKNTGERTLHSVLTTERFQMEGVHVAFKNKEGVLLNGDKTQALISRIDPGKAFGLEAEVILPENIKSQELFNYVTVVTKETGEKTTEASAGIKVLGKEPELIETPQVAEESEEDSIEKSTTIQPSSNPKTSDETKITVWVSLFLSAFLSVLCIFWSLKAQRKH